MSHRTQLATHKPVARNFRLKPLVGCIRLVITSGLFAGMVAPVQAELPIAGVVAAANGGVAIPWVGFGSADLKSDGTNMQINQHSDKAILNWEKFNVGKGNTVQFIQETGSSAVALNRIYQQDPSQILGHVTANGQVYLVNSNGFVFGKDSTVDVHGLVASALNVSDDTFKNGITQAVTKGQAAFEGNLLDTNGKKIQIEIQKGAQIKAAEGGRIIVLAPTILNSGNVEAKGGQVIMAAATDKVYLQEAPTDTEQPDGTITHQTNSDVRGLLVEVKTGGKVENLGTIAANRGNVTLMGFAVNQGGKVSATTSTSLNGTVRLLAREGGSVVSGQIQSTSTVRSKAGDDGLGVSATVTLAEGSTTEILPELEYVEKTVKDANGVDVKKIVEVTSIAGQVQPQSRVEIMANKVSLKAAAKIVAPGGKVDIKATDKPQYPISAEDPVIDGTIKNTSQIVIDSGASIDVSGLDVTKTMESNIVEVKLQSNELADSPLQKNGKLFGKTVLIDIRDGSTLTDMTPVLAKIQYTLAERLSTGGQILLQSEGDVAIKAGAVLDFSGGNVTYLDGQITTTKLTSNGRIYDIGKADPLLTYDGVYGTVVRIDHKWGVTTTWNVDGPFMLSRFEQGYVQGQNAGSLLINSNGAQLDGTLLGHAISGRRQRSQADRAKGGTLEVNNQLSTLFSQDIVFSSQNGLAAALTVDPDKLFNSGVQKAVFNTINGSITIDKSAVVKLTEGSQLSLTGSAIDVAGSIKGAGATVKLETVFVKDVDGHINLADTANVALQGRWINDFANPENLIGNTPVSIKGGSFSIKAAGDVTLQAGSSVDVSGGGWVQASRKLTAGSAGEISLIAARIIPKTGDKVPGSNLTIDGILTGYGLEKGGKLTVEANAVDIGNQLKASASGLHPLQLDNKFFNQGGFADFVITANTNGLTVKEGSTINLVQKNRILNNQYINSANAEDIAAISAVKELLPELRSTSSLALNTNHSKGKNDSGKLLVEKNVQINADDLSTVMLESDSSINFNGAITAHGGDVSLKIVKPKVPDGVTSLNYLLDQGIWLGSSAKIDVSGFTKTSTDKLGHVLGKVVNGGSVNLTANRGFVATMQGSVLDVSGTEARLDVPNKGPIGIAYSPDTIGSNAGSIGFFAAEGVFIAGDMQARAGNALGTAGGTLSVQIDNTKREVPTDLSADAVDAFMVTPRILTISQAKAPIFTDTFSKAEDQLPSDKNKPGFLNGYAFLAADQVSDAGFSSVILQADKINFRDNVSLTVNNKLKLDAPVLGWETTTAGGQGIVSLNARTVALGSTLFKSPAEMAALNGAQVEGATDGKGQLTVRADLIELLGGSVTQGINEVNLIAEKDIRLNGYHDANNGRDIVGEFTTYSKLNLTADQIYPSTLSQFTLAVDGDAAGAITIDGNHKSAPLLSAYGSLIVKAPNINQNGILKAPFGEIVLEASNTVKFGANSITSVSAEDQLIPFGMTSAGKEWLYPIIPPKTGVKESGQNLMVKAWQDQVNLDNNNLVAPQKKIRVTADKILSAEGAVIDLSGGGDLQAYEFVPGAGGSRDVLDTTKAYAVMPTLAGYAPFDPVEMPKSGLSVGDSVYLSAGSGLAAGQYTLLPAHYALLPGAFLITPKTNSVAVIPGTSSLRTDGAPIVSGYRTIAGTGIKDQTWSEFVVEPGSVALKRSEFTLSQASDFFSKQALNNDQIMPRLPQDGGQLVLNGISQLDLPSVLAGGSIGGLGGMVDIISANLNIVSEKTGLAGVELLASDIKNLKIGSLLLGGSRSIDAVTGNTVLDVKANSVTIAEDVKLVLPEIMLAATDTVELKKNASITAQGDIVETANKTEFETVGDGALLRVSAGQQAIIKRTDAQGVTGDLIINSGAVIAAGAGSILMDSTHNAILDGQLDVSGSLAIGAEAINLGEVPGNTNGLTIDKALLSKFVVDELVLTSRSAINLYGDLGQLKFGNLVLDGAGLYGYNNDGKTAQINADTVTLANHSGRVENTAGTGAGSLNIHAGSLILDKSRIILDKSINSYSGFTLAGFEQINFNLDNALIGRSESQLNLLGNTLINTGVVSGESIAKMFINAAGYDLTLANTGQVPDTVAKGIAAQLNLSAKAVTVDTQLVFKGGSVKIDSLQGNTTLGSQALIDVSGALVKAGLSPSAVINSGQIILSSQKQNVVAEVGSQLLLNANAALMQAGALTINAAEGQASLNGLIDARGFGNELGGTIALDVNSLTASGFGGLNSKVFDSGFSGGFDLRLRSGDLSIANGQTVTAHTINIAVDNGLLSVDGTLDAQGIDGGSIALSTTHDLTLEEHANLLANAEGSRGNGGKVYLSSVNGTGVGAVIKIINGAQIDVSKVGDNVKNYAGNKFIANVDDGEVHLRLDRLDTNGNSITNFVKALPGDVIVGNAKTVVEAVRVYEDSSISAADITKYKTDTNTYMTALYAKNTSANSFQLTPGIEITSKDNIVLAGIWDFATWRYGADKSAPGFLTLRAANDLVVNKNITDGFANGTVDAYNSTTGNVATTPVTDKLQSGLSWSYKLVAGADASSANNSVVASGKGNLTLEAATKIRTGTGDIEIHAGQDIEYKSDTSVIYTAGKPDAIDPYGFIKGIGVDFYAEYPIDGGDISVTAVRDIKGVASTNLINDWLVRIGNFDMPGAEKVKPTAWGIRLGNWRGLTADYRESLGALGGGNINIKAGGNISDMSVVIPTSGKQADQKPSTLDKTILANRKKYFDSLENLFPQINGGGNLSMTSGGDIAGGVFYVDGGAARITAAGSLMAGNNALNPQLALGDAKFTLTAGNNIALAAILDPMVLPQGTKTVISNQLVDMTSLFFRYSPDSAVALTSVAGDIDLNNTGGGASKIYPATLKASALAGDLHILGDLTLYASKKGQLELFASNAINGSGRLIMSDSNPEKLPSYLHPDKNFLLADYALNQTNPNPEFITNWHATTPVHQDDFRPVLISTDNGDIGSGSLLNFNVAKSVLVQSGKNIVNVDFKIQHNASDSSSLITAAKDIKYTIKRTSTTGILEPEDKQIEVSGPGQLTLISGRDVDLGASGGVTSIGNTKNSALPNGGANISVIAGLADGKIDVAGFASKYMAGEGNKYAAENQLYVKQLTNYMRDITGQESLSTAESIAAFSNLSKVEQARFEKQLFALVQGVYFNELKVASTDLANAKFNQDQDVAKLTIFKLIETLFPGSTLLSPNAAANTLLASDKEGEKLLVSDKYKEYFTNLAKLDYVDNNKNASSIIKMIKDITAIVNPSKLNLNDTEQVNAGKLELKKLGDISLFFSRIHTEGGGDINLLTPNGGVNAGLAVSSGIAADRLGIIVKSKGNINAIVRDDFAVNKARVMTLDGGSIAMGSTLGDINAGLGAQSAIASPPPLVTYKDGLPIITPRAALSGSGIRTSSFPGQPQGDVLLYALNGVIDAGEAGIDGNNLTLTANSIVGASNITFGGTGVGVPVAAVGSVAAGLTGTSNATANSSQTAQAATEADDKGKAATQSLALGMLSVDLLGFGEGSAQGQQTQPVSTQTPQAQPQVPKDNKELIPEVSTQNKKRQGT